MMIGVRGASCQNWRAFSPARATLAKVAVGLGMAGVRMVDAQPGLYASLGPLAAP